MRPTRSSVRCGSRRQRSSSRRVSASGATRSSPGRRRKARWCGSARRRSKGSSYKASAGWMSAIGCRFSSRRSTSIAVSSISFVHKMRSTFQLAFMLSIAAPALAGQAARTLTSGDAIYQGGCAGCHGPNGEGAPQTFTAFDRPATFPDFTDCAGTTPELDVDWKATITQGGHGRGFSPIMPSFAEELTSAQIDAVITYMRGLCREPSWPRGELNLPRPLRTEKAFPESETVVTMSLTGHRSPDLDSELTYEHRYTRRDQLEVAVPF